MYASVMLVVAAAAAAAAQEVPIPSKPDGFRYPAYGNRSAPVQIEGHFDLMCPDCKAAWPQVKAALSQFSSNDVAFTMHTFPLPYHHNAFTASMGAHAVALSGKSVFSWLEAVFAAQESFGNSETANDSFVTITNLFGKLAESTPGVNIPQEQFVQDLNNGNYDEDTRVSWKLSCSRGVSGTPTFFVNGARVAADDSWTVQQWVSLIKQVLG